MNATILATMMRTLSIFEHNTSIVSAVLIGRPAGKKTPHCKP